MSDLEVTHQLVTGKWLHLSGSKVIAPDGVISFVPIFDALQQSFSYSLGVVPGLVTDGLLKDTRGNVGVYLAAYLNGQPVKWRANFLSLLAEGVEIPRTDIVFDPDRKGVHLNLVTRG